MNTDKKLQDFKKEIEKLREIDGAEEYAKQLAHLFLGNGLSLQTILLMAIDFGQQHPQWTPVEEELPKEGGEYLVSDGTDSMVDIWLHGIGWSKPDNNERVTHWMPKPLPPRKEE